MTELLFSALNLAILALIFHCCRRRTGTVLYWFAFLLPLQGLSLSIGVLLSWTRLALPLSLALMLVARCPARTCGPPAAVGWAALITYSTINTSLWWISDYADGYHFARARFLGWGIAQAELRYLVQWGSQISTWGLAYTAYLFTDRADDVLDGIVHGAVANASVGFYQVAAVATGLPWFDVSASAFLTDEFAKATMMDFGLLRLPRLHGLAGEPKHAAAQIVLALAVVLARGPAPSRHAGTRSNLATSATLLIGLALTGSTSGLIALLGVLVAILLSKGRGWRQSDVLRHAIPLGLGLVPVFLLFGTDHLAAFLDSRLASRLEDPLYFEPKDAGLVEMALEQPVAALFGWGAGGADFRLIDFVREDFVYKAGRTGTLTPAYFVTRTIADVGLLGLAILAAIYVRLVSDLSNDASLRRIGIAFGVVVVLAPATIAATIILALSSLAISSRERVPPDRLAGASQ